MFNREGFHSAQDLLDLYRNGRRNRRRPCFYLGVELAGADRWQLATSPDQQLNLAAPRKA